jgi:hypothetical protein
LKFHIKALFNVVMRTQFRPDEVIGNTLLEVKAGLDSVGKLRAAIMQLAYALTERGLQSTALLILADPKFTEERLYEEWQCAAKTLNPQIIERLTLVRFLHGEFHGLPQNLSSDIRSRLEDVVRQQVERGGTRVPATRTYYEILKILIHQWLHVSGPMTATWLAKTVGCSYPTVASALERLGGAIRRHSDRSFELAQFPRDEWSRLVAVADRARATMRFADRSGQPRSPDSLLKRVQQLDRPDIAIGGVLGAKHYHPQLDLVGNPRLEFTLHSPISASSRNLTRPWNEPKTFESPPALCCTSFGVESHSFKPGRRDCTGLIQWSAPWTCTRRGSNPRRWNFCNHFRP